MAAPGLIESDVKNPVLRWIDQRMPIFTMMEKEHDVGFAYYYGVQDFDTTISMLVDGRIDPTPMVTSEVDLDAG